LTVEVKTDHLSGYVISCSSRHFEGTDNKVGAVFGFEAAPLTAFRKPLDLPLRQA